MRHFSEPPPLDDVSRRSPHSSTFIDGAQASECPRPSLLFCSPTILKLNYLSCAPCSGNGKGVCKEMLEHTLGEYYGVMSEDAVVKAPGQRPPSKGAATGYIAE